MSKISKRSRKSLRTSLIDLLDGWIRDVQCDDDELRMWVHEKLAQQMADSCMTLLDACRDSQNFTREQEA